MLLLVQEDQAVVVRVEMGQTEVMQLAMVVAEGALVLLLLDTILAEMALLA
jgi:hypothetical protein